MPHVSLNQTIDDIRTCPEGKSIQLLLVKHLVKLYRLVLRDYNQRRQLIDHHDALEMLSSQFSLTRPTQAIIIINIFVALMLANHQLGRVMNNFNIDIWFRLELATCEQPVSIPTNIVLVFSRVLPMRARIFKYMNQFYSALPGIDMVYHEKILSLSTLVFGKQIRIVRLALSLDMHLDGFVRLMLQSNKSLAISAAECLCAIVSSNQVSIKMMVRTPGLIEALRRLLGWADEFASCYAGYILLHCCRLSDVLCGDVIVHPSLMCDLKNLKDNLKVHKDVRKVASDILHCCQIRQVSARIKLRRQRRADVIKGSAHMACLMPANRVNQHKQTGGVDADVGLTPCMI
jgi:hypothetical protein